MTWYHFVVSIHIIGAIIWVGGIFFLGLIAVPVLRRQQATKRAELLTDFGNRFRTIGYAILGLLVITGIIQAIYHGATVTNVLNGTFFQTHFGSSLAKKLLFFGAMVAVSVVHDFYVGPASARAAQEGRDTEALRTAASWLARLTALLALGVVIFAIIMLR